MIAATIELAGYQHEAAFQGTCQQRIEITPAPSGVKLRSINLSRMPVFSLLPRPKVTEKDLPQFQFGGRSVNRLAAMEAFSCVIDTGSFSAAPPQLRAAQPAIPKTIAQLENLSGVRLLMRSMYGLMPNETGQNSSVHAKRSV